MKPICSIIIPAHNEEQVIGRCVASLLEASAPGEFEIVVVCNGCRDGTAREARRFGERVRVIETDRGSKTHALNLGDEAAKAWPRLYVDADVVMGAESVRRLVKGLEGPGVLAVSPRAVMEFGEGRKGASWGVRAYYKVWLRLPYVQEGLMGTGVYGLSREGRGRFEAFPDLIADDGYVRMLFRGRERLAVKEARSIVTAPQKLRDLVKIKTRSRLGGYELRARHPELARQEQQEKQYGGALRGMLGRPGLWAAVVVYLWVNLLSRVRAKRQLEKRLAGREYRWERDESSRGKAAGEKRILAIASGGGHWVQLLRLRPAFEGHRVAFVTVKRAYQKDVGNSPFYLINDATRWSRIGLVKMALGIAWILVRERPHVIVSTGAAPGFFALRLGRLMGAKTVWLDSIANIEQLSMTGQLVGRHADLWLTQWEHLAKQDGPRYEGGVL